MKQYKTLDMNDGRGGEHIQTHARPLWIISTFLISYLLNLASSTANVLWLPDPLALTLIYWTIHHPRHVGMTIAFICGLLMDVQNGSVLGQQALACPIRPTPYTAGCPGSDWRARRCTSCRCCSCPSSSS